MYRQLYDWFQQAIVGGQLRPGQSVPSSRSLAAELHISRIPVFNAYEQLCAEGYLETFVGAGTRVARSIPDDELRPAHGKELHASRRSLVVAGPRRKSRRADSTDQCGSPAMAEHFRRFPRQPARARSLPYRKLVEAGGASLSRAALEDDGLW